MNDVSISHVGKRFGKVSALQDVSLALPAGTRVALIGSNGSGKTTLLRAVLGLLRVEGTIRIGGFDVARDPRQALSRVAYVPQMAPPMDAPIGELLRLWSRLRSVRRGDVIERARLLGLDVVHEEKKRFADLSGGMKQKLLAAFALAIDAPVLVCDEPTANLDPQARVAFCEQVAARPRGKSVILCSHRLDEVRQLVDRVVELREGAVVQDCTLGAMLEDMRAFRVEVWLRDTARDAAQFLVAAGFSAAGRDRYAALLTQEDKLAVIERLIRTYDTALRDLSVYQVESIPTKLRTVHP